MTKNWMEAIDARSAAALASGALQPVAAEQTEMEDAGMRFIVRWVSSLAVKDAARAASTTTSPAATPVAIPAPVGLAVKVVVGGVQRSYVVAAAEPDGTGVTRLLLEAAAP